MYEKGGKVGDGVSDDRENGETDGNGIELEVAKPLEMDVGIVAERFTEKRCDISLSQRVKGTGGGNERCIVVENFQENGRFDSCERKKKPVKLVLCEHVMI